VLVLFIQLDGVFQIEHLSIDLDPDKSRSFCIVKDFLELPLLPDCNRCTDNDSCAFLRLENGIDDLVDAHLADRTAAHMTMRSPHARPQETKIVINLGNRSNSRARIAMG